MSDHTIKRTRGDDVGIILPDEGTVGSEAITPGHLVEYGGSDDIQKHANAGQNAEKMFALESTQHEPAAGTKQIDHDYPSGDSVRVLYARRGALIYAFLADGNNVSKGDPLESDGAGGLQAHTPQAVDEGGTATYTIYSDAIVAYAAEALNNTSGSQSRILVRVA